MTLKTLPPSRTLACWLGAWAVALFMVAGMAAADVRTRQFDLPADVAARSLKLFAQQSDVEVLIRAEIGREARTQAVKGGFTPRQALDLMLADTGLTVREDEKTGAMTIIPVSRTNGPQDAAVMGEKGEAAKKKARKP